MTLRWKLLLIAGIPVTMALMGIVVIVAVRSSAGSPLTPELRAQAQQYCVQSSIPEYAAPFTQDVRYCGGYFEVYHPAPLLSGGYTLVNPKTGAETFCTLVENNNWRCWFRGKKCRETSLCSVLAPL